MSNMVTRCPQCHTSFRVTEEHLKLANGAVRCGSCLLVFQARQHWVNPEAATAASTSTPPPAANNKFRLDESTLESMAASAHGSFKTTADDSLLSDNGRPSKTFDLSAAVRPTTPVSQTTQKKIDDIGDDDKISDDIDLEDDEPVIVAPKKTEVIVGDFGDPDDDYSSVFDDEIADDQTTGIAQDSAFDNFNDVDDLLNDSPAQHSYSDATADESWAKDILEEETQVPQPAPIDLNEVDDVRDILQDFSNPVDVDAASRDLGFGRRDPFAAVDLGNTQRGGHRAEMIAHIDPLPVDLLSTRAGRLKSDLKSTLLLSASVVGLSLLLVAQYVFFNFDRLARTSSSRPYMQTVCHVFHCQLPVVENWRYIKIQNLVVRKNAQVPDALVIDAMLLNVTDQALPFPELDLFFSDLTKTPVASRRFKPAEYLSGELSGQTMMPPGSPVHIALDIVNPGEKAVNWSMLVAGNVE